MRFYLSWSFCSYLQKGNWVAQQGTILKSHFNNCSSGLDKNWKQFITLPWMPSKGADEGEEE